MRQLTTYFPAVLAAVMAAPAWAEEAHHASKGALPQFRTEFYAGEIFWLIVTFTLLYVLLKKVALPRITSVQDQRQQQRTSDLAAAAQANEEAKQIIAAYEKALAEARAQAQTRLGQIMTAQQQEAAAAAAKQQGLMDQRMSEAQGRIDAMRTQMLSNVREMAIQLTAAIVNRLTGVDASAMATSAVDAAHQRKRTAA